MRSTRWLILAAIFIIAGAVAVTYFRRMEKFAREKPPAVTPLPAGNLASGNDWHYQNSNGNCRVLEVHAKTFKQVKDPATFELENVALQLFHECGKKFDYVKSAKAQFDTVSGLMFSEGDVEITRGLSVNRDTGEADPPSAKLVKVFSSGVRFETKTGKVTTDKAAHFLFARGDGRCVGAEYDPNTHELLMKSSVELNLKPKQPGGVPAKIETGTLLYKEHESKVLMNPWGKLTRGTLVMNTASAVATLNKGKLKLVEAQNAWGERTDPGRKVSYQAEQLTINLNDQAEVETMVAERKAHLVSTTDTAHTDVQADRLDLGFTPSGHESELTTAKASGHGVVNSNPVTKPGTPPGETRLLKSEAIDMKMRSGGQEIESVETEGPGTLEFIPNRPDRPHRTLNAAKLWIAYGEDNQIQSFRSIDASTRTENPPKAGKPVPPSITSSKELRAEFDQKTHQMSRLDQTSDFHYQAGDRKASADKATLDQATDTMILTGSARIADLTGSATADRIVMNQKSGDFDADGHVTSTRLPEKKGQASSAMLNNDEPMQAKSNSMTSRDSNLVIHYEGKAVAWQGANRVEADKIDIDRDDGVMKAEGQVISQFVDKPKKGKDGKPAPNQATVFTVVRAPKMTYTEEDRTAVYTGGVVLNRPNMNVKSDELKAFLKDKDSDSSLDKAFADGAVSILQTMPGRTRTGTAEHGEYYTGEEKTILEKGQPKFVDSLRGTTEGEKLTYFANDDRLLVNGAETQRAESTLHRATHQKKKASQPQTP